MFNLIVLVFFQFSAGSKNPKITLKLAEFKTDSKGKVSDNSEGDIAQEGFWSSLELKQGHKEILNSVSLGFVFSCNTWFSNVFIQETERLENAEKNHSGGDSAGNVEGRGKWG